MPSLARVSCCPRRGHGAHSARPRPSAARRPRRRRRAAARALHRARPTDIRWRCGRGGPPIPEARSCSCTAGRGAAGPDFDLQVPGLQRSVMSVSPRRALRPTPSICAGTARRRVTRPGWLTPRRMASDVINVLAWIAGQHPALPKPALVGWSRGAAISMMAAQMAPARIVGARAVRLRSSIPRPQFADATCPRSPRWTKNTAEAAASDFISPKVTPPAVITRLRRAGAQGRSDPDRSQERRRVQSPQARSRDRADAGDVRRAGSGRERCGCG